MLFARRRRAAVDNMAVTADPTTENNALTVTAVPTNPAEQQQ